MKQLWSDERGSVDLIQFVVVLPIFVLLLYGSFEIWKIVSVKQSLSAATYQAARCRSVYSRWSEESLLDMDDDDFRCERVLLHELVNNSLIDREDLVGMEIRYRNERGDVICVVAVNHHLELEKRFCQLDPTQLGRNQRFDVEAALFLPWPIFIPGLLSEGDEPAGSPTLVARHRSYIEAPPEWVPPTPRPVPTRSSP